MPSLSAACSMIGRAWMYPERLRSSQLVEYDYVSGGGEGLTHALSYRLTKVDTDSPLSAKLRVSAIVF